MREKKLFIIDTICAVLVAAIDLAFPYVSKSSMQTYLPQSMYKTFFVVMAILAAAYVLKAVLYYVITVLGHRMGVNIESRMREDLYSHMQALSFGFYDKNRTGTLMSRLTGDLFEITELAHHGPENIIICALTIVGSMIIMFTINWQLTLVLAVLLPLCLWFTLKCRVKMKDANMEVKRKMGIIYSALENGVSGVRTAKAFANEELEKQKFDAANDMYRGAKKEYYKTMGAFMSGMEFTTRYHARRGHCRRRSAYHERPLQLHRPHNLHVVRFDIHQSSAQAHAVCRDLHAGHRRLRALP